MYLVHYSYGTQAKNKLESSFADYLKQKDRLLISNNRVEDFQQEILDDYARLCAIHNRCKGIEKKFYENRGDFFLFGSNAEFKLLKSKE